MGVHVPERGKITRINAEGLGGREWFLEVRHKLDGSVLALENFEAATHVDAQADNDWPTGIFTEEMAGGVPAYSDYEYDLADLKQIHTYHWRYNKRTHPTPGSVAANYHETAILNGMKNLVSGYKPCGLRRNFAAYHKYVGDTVLGANVTYEANCAGTYSDGRSTVSWGRLEPDAFGPEYGPLAVACTSASYKGSAGDEIDEVDVAMDRGDPSYKWLVGEPRASAILG